MPNIETSNMIKDIMNYKPKESYLEVKKSKACRLGGINNDFGELVQKMKKHEKNKEIIEFSINRRIEKKEKKKELNERSEDKKGNKKR